MWCVAISPVGGEQIKEINPGVSIQAGDTVRMGPESVIPPNKQTRKEYLRGGERSFDSMSYMDSPTGVGSGLASPGGPGGVQFAVASQLFASPGRINLDILHHNNNLLMR